MNDIDWAAPATLYERDDQGSDLHVHFRKIEQGQLGALVRKVAALPVSDRARLVIDSGSGTINVGQIMDLAQRKHLP